MRICFDLDETLCQGATPGPDGTDYSTCEPIGDAARRLRELRADGNTVIIQTARGMGGNHGNLGAAVAAVAAITFKQLEAWGFEYDEIYFGKPSADLYVDDKGMTALDFWEHPGWEN